MAIDRHLNEFIQSRDKGNFVVLNLISGICFVVVGIGLLLRVFGVTKLSTPEQNAAWLAKYGKRIKWLAPLAIVLGIFNIARSIEFKPVAEQATVSTVNALEDEQTAREIAEELSQGLPRLLGPGIIFEAVTAEHATVTFKYKLEYPPNSLQEAEEAKAKIESTLLERICSREQIRQLMLQIPGRALIVFDDGTKFSDFSQFS